MLEVDIFLCFEDGILIMVYLFNIDSDFLFIWFLEKIVGLSKGFKLDFKEIVVVEFLLKIFIDQIIEQYGVIILIWFNVDIFYGFCYIDCNNFVDLKVFFFFCVKYFFLVILLVGWIIGNYIFIENGGYDWYFVWLLKELFLNLIQLIIFLIRVNLIGNLIEQLIWFFGFFDEYILIIWLGNFDILNMKDFVVLRNRVFDKIRIFYDLFLDQEIKFKEELKYYR